MNQVGVSEAAKKPFLRVFYLTHRNMSGKLKAVFAEKHFSCGVSS